MDPLPEDLGELNEEAREIIGSIPGDACDDGGDEVRPTGGATLFRGTVFGGPIFVDGRFGETLCAGDLGNPPISGSFGTGGGGCFETGPTV